MAAILAVLAGAAISAGGAAYAGSQQKKAAGDLANAYKNPKQYEPELLGLPDQINSRYVANRTVDDGLRHFDKGVQLSRKVNKFNYNEALKYYNQVQPYFSQLQNQVGQNALSFSRGELPNDVVASIGRASAQRGIQGGFGFGSQGGKTGALANLNLRNLGLTSLDLSRYGTNLAMQATSQAKSLLPSMTSPTDWMLSPGQQLGIEQFNIGARNDFTVRNNNLLNQAAQMNTGLANQSTENMAKAQMQGTLAEGQMVQSIANSLGGAISGLPTGAGGGLFGGSAASNPYQFQNIQPQNYGQAMNTSPGRLA